MTRNKRQIKEFESEFKRMERAAWRVEGGGDTHFKLLCHNDCKCRMTVSTTPGGGNPLRVFTAQRHRSTLEGGLA